VPTVQTKTEQTNDTLAPGVQKRARGVRAGVNDGVSSSDTLQTDRLPHDQQFVVGTRGNNDHVARLGEVDRRLNRSARSHHGGGFATNRDAYGVDGFLAVGSGDD